MFGGEFSFPSPCNGETGWLRVSIDNNILLEYNGKCLKISLNFTVGATSLCCICRKT